jgi:hypothetical protein
MEERVLKTIEALKRNNFEARYFETSGEAVEYLLSVIPENSSVGIGGSMTIKTIGIVEKMQDRGNNVLFHWLGKGPEEVKSIRRKAINADVYMASTNAVTMDGKLINIDGTGNRVAGMFYGPEKVYLVCGVNKIAENEEKGFERIRNNAWKNAERLKLKTPCVTVKKCVDCKVKDRMCNVSVVMSRKPQLTDIEVIIVNEELGY